MKRLLLCALAVWLLGGPVRAQDQPTDDLVPPTSAADFTASRLDDILAGAWRSPEHKARDAFRHPKATLSFFGLRPDQTVVEITPGGGWYAEILAPLLGDDGQYVAAVPRGQAADLRAKFAADPDRFGHARVLEFDPQAPVFGPAGSADLVLSFRNVHNWQADGTAAAMFKGFFDVLRPGGVLGLVDHRAAAGSTLASVAGTGYLPTSYVVKLAAAAGFVFDAASDINANPRDSRDHPKGVWTLPPTLALGQTDRAHYLAIGESDRMTLRFVKPEASGTAARSH